jgi:hypothetical protein
MTDKEKEVATKPLPPHFIIPLPPKIAKAFIEDIKKNTGCSAWEVKHETNIP